MLKPQDKALPDGDVVVTELDGEGVLLHLGTKQYFSLNTTGLKIWQMLAAELSLGEVGERLCQEYGIAPERAERCVADLVAQLRREQLVSVISA